MTRYLEADLGNGVARTTGVVAATGESAPFKGAIVFTCDAAPIFVDSEPTEIRFQHIDAAYGRAINEGRGIVGEGGNSGAGVVGIAGAALPTPTAGFPRQLHEGPQPGRGVRAGVIGIGGAQQATGSVEVLGQGGAIGVLGESDTAPGVRGDSNSDDGVVGRSQGDGKSGVFGLNSAEKGSVFGVMGRSDSMEGVGVYGNNDNGDGVFGFSKRGRGVRGNSKEHDGIIGVTEATGKSGVHGVNNSFALARNAPVGGVHAYGVMGEADAAHGTGVFGVSKAGNGLLGKGGRYGASLTGHIAPLHLSPSADEGPPPTAGHTTGELYVDKNGDLFYFKNGAWYRIQLAPA